MQRIRNVVRTLHLCLGLTTGAVVFVVAITGCLWVFQDELTSLSQSHQTVVSQDKPFLLPSIARKLAEEELPGRAIHGVLYGGPTEALEVIFYEEEPEFYQSVFLNPYSGEVLKVSDHLSGFFAFVLEGHLHLWLPEAIGTQIVSWSTLIFVVMLLSGLFLWWPKGKGQRKQKFWFVWNATTKWKRKNYDLHSIAGMYAFAVALLAATTGLVMAFDWFEKGVYKAAGGEKGLQFVIPENVSGVSDSGVVNDPNLTAPIDRLPARLKQEYPHARSFELHYPSSHQSSIYVEIAYEDGVYYSSDYRFYDQNTLQEVQTPSVYGAYAQAGFADKLIRMNYDTHVGAILGLPGKVLMFCSSLIVASLPVTGFLFWWGKRKRGKRHIRQQAIARRSWPLRSA